MSGLSDVPTYSRGDKEYASKTMAALTRAEWEDYKTRFQPYEKKLKQLAIGGDVNTQIDTAKGLVDASFGQASAAMDQQLDKYGVSADQQTQQANNRSLSLSHASSLAGAENNVRLTNYDRQNELMAGSSVGGMKSIAGGN